MWGQRNNRTDEPGAVGPELRGDMITTHRLKKPSPRSGLTWVDVIVMLIIMALLAMLFVPTVRTAGTSARKLECLNNIRNCGLAIQNLASGSGGALPPLVTALPISRGSKTGQLPVPWTVQILPAIDATSLLRSIKFNAINTSGVTPDVVFQIAPTDVVWIQAYTCPNDLDSHRQPGGLSYVVNAGFISSEIWGTGETKSLVHQPYFFDWDRAAGRSPDGVTGTLDPLDLATEVATGVFWRPTPTDEFVSSLDYISEGDGAATTLMLSDNLNAGRWMDVTVNQIGFGIELKSKNGVVAPGQLTGLAATGLLTQAPDSWMINRPKMSLYAPRPSSAHAGGVNVILCDGSGRFLSNNIDKAVYVKLVTSNGVAFGEEELNNGSY